MVKYAPHMEYEPIVFKLDAGTYPIDLLEFTSALTEIAVNYNDFVNSTYKDVEGNASLFISDIRKGSIVVDLLGASLPLIPALANLVPAEWLGHFSIIFNHAVNNTLNMLRPREKVMAKAVGDLVSHNEGDSLTISTTGDNSPVIVNIVHNDGLKASRNIMQDDIEHKKLNANIVQKEVFHWVQARFDGSTAGNKGVIETVSKKPLKVIFADKNVESIMKHDSPSFDVSWQDLAYIVDAEVKTINGEPKAYKIFYCYLKDTFNPND